MCIRDREIENGQVTGRVVGQIVNGQRKADLLKDIATQEGISLEQVIAVGDGANDLPMLGEAGLGIAFRAKPLVKQNAEQAISTLGLDPFKLFQHIPATMVKFEGSFTQELSKAEGRERLTSIIKQVKEGNRKTVVGFVESAAQMQALWTLGGVDYLQGYYLQAPMDKLEIPDAA